MSNGIPKYYQDNIGGVSHIPLTQQQQQHNPITLNENSPPLHYHSNSNNSNIVGGVGRLQQQHSPHQQQLPSFALLAPHNIIYSPNTNTNTLTNNNTNNNILSSSSSLYHTPPLQPIQHQHQQQQQQHHLQQNKQQSQQQQYIKFNNLGGNHQITSPTFNNNNVSQRMIGSNSIGGGFTLPPLPSPPHLNHYQSPVSSYSTESSMGSSFIEPRSPMALNASPIQYGDLTSFKIPISLPSISSPGTSLYQMSTSPDPPIHMSSSPYSKPLIRSLTSNHHNNNHQQNNHNNNNNNNIYSNNGNLQDEIITAPSFRNYPFTSPPLQSTPPPPPSNNNNNNQPWSTTSKPVNINQNFYQQQQQPSQPIQQQQIFIDTPTNLRRNVYNSPTPPFYSANNRSNSSSSIQESSSSLLIEPLLKNEISSTNNNSQLYNQYYRPSTMSKSAAMRRKNNPNHIQQQNISNNHHIPVQFIQQPQSQPQPQPSPSISTNSTKKRNNNLNNLNNLNHQQQQINQNQINISQKMDEITLLQQSITPVPKSTFSCRFDLSTLASLPSNPEFCDKDFPELEGKFKILEKIGQGTFSGVYKSVCLKGEYRGSVVALKRVSPTSSPTRILNEIVSLLKVGGQHNISPLLGIMRHLDQVTLILPYFEHDSFKDYFFRINALEFRNYLVAIFSALKHVHEKSICHRDVKPTNFLYNQKLNQFMLIDFGLAQEMPPIELTIESKGKKKSNQTNIIDPSKQQAPRAGTRGFRAPEVLLKYNKQTTAIDIWSVGVIMMCVLSGRYPFFVSPDDMTSLAEIVSIIGTNKIVELAKQLDKTIEISENIPGQSWTDLAKKLRDESGPTKEYMPDEAYHLLERCLDPSPFKRISAHQALSHPFLLSNHL